MTHTLTRILAVVALLTHDALRFHLFNDTRRTVIADSELTLNAGN